MGLSTTWCSIMFSHDFDITIPIIYNNSNEENYFDHLAFIGAYSARLSCADGGLRKFV